jgi:hypothetical protein
LLSLTICGEGWLVLFGKTVWHEGWLIIGWFWEVIPATDSCKSKLIPYHQLLQKSLSEKGTIIPKFIKSKNQAILPAIQSNPLSRAQSVNHPQQSTSTAVVPQQKTSTGAKPNTIVRIFVDGKPVALTTDPTVLQDHTSLLNKLGGGQIQSGTYSVTVSAHRVPSSNTSPIDFLNLFETDFVSTTKMIKLDFVQIEKQNLRLMKVLMPVDCLMHL